MLYLGTQFVMKTADGGARWQETSPDLDQLRGEADPKPSPIRLLLPPPADHRHWRHRPCRRANVGGHQQPHGAAHSATGADWQKVTPAGLPDSSERILYIEPRHSDAGSGLHDRPAPCANRLRPMCCAPTTTAKTWQKIVNGFPPDEMVRVVREDPKRKCLLYAGTDTGVFISWDDGDHWQPFSLNLPPTPITDLTVHENDLVDFDLRAQRCGSSTM